MLRDKLKHKNIILASGSPRRQEFFKDLGVDFEIKLKEIDEVYPEHLKAEEITDYLAVLKATAFDGELKEDDVLITSDTIVWLHEKALGKPKNYDDAFTMLSDLSNTTHEVITSVCFKTNKTTDVFHDKTKVTFEKLSDESIRYYLDNFKPFDKAGSYGVQEWIGWIGIKKMEGSYANVVGMPVHLVFKKLATFI
ncbi:Maf-like protein [Flavobacterium sp. UBA6135]|uniref:Maf-like protein n=1 Tax=Flavobacterium sp. UBA6135 TaxID=1946553 RepID=UPI0025C441AB|nr:Maf-like protein [Flavobacterium sp. UBA6135]